MGPAVDACREEEAGDGLLLILRMITSVSLFLLERPKHFITVDEVQMVLVVDHCTFHLFHTVTRRYI